MQSRARARHARPAEDHNKECAENFFCWIHAQLAHRRENRLSKYFEPANFSQRKAKINFSPREVTLNKPASGREIVPCGEKKCAGAQIEAEINSAKCA